MGDEVKITVIATGFERSNLPVIDRHANVLERERTPEAVPDEHELAAVMAETEAAIGQKEADEPTDKNDLDMPAFLRRERKLFQ
jgi:hypothetical protein